MPPQPPIQGVYRTDLRARAAYAEGAGIYRILPAAVALPADAKDLARLVCWAADHSMTLTPRGAGSAMGGGNVGEGVAVDLTRLADRRIDLDPAAKRAVTGPGIMLAELNSAAARHNLRLPPDPSSGRWATVGGMVATNAAGARSVRYGSVRPWVESLTLLTSDGQSVALRRGAPADRSTSAAVNRFWRDAAPAIQNAGALIGARFPRTRKNSSGYALDAFLASGDLIDLVIGSEGTLGFITEIQFRLDIIPALGAGLRVVLDSLDQLGEAVIALRPCRPSAVELLDQTFLELLGKDALVAAGLAFPPADAILLVELEADDRDAMSQAVEEAATLVQPFARSVDTSFSAAAAERLWSVRHAASPILASLPEDRRSLQVIEDACVPTERMTEYIRGVRLAARKRDLPVVMFGHAGDGHIHANLLPRVDQPGWEPAVADLLEEVTDTLIRLGGTPSGEHGDGRLRAGALERVYGPEILELFRLVKRTFDPAGIFNPGIILSSGQPPISRLKVGASAAALPQDLERELREIERTGGYAKLRLELADELGARS